MMERSAVILLIIKVFGLMTVAGESLSYEYYDTYDEPEQYHDDTNRRPTFLEEPREFTAKVGDQVVFPCNVEKTDHVMTFSYVSDSPRIGGKSLYFAAENAVRKVPRFRKEGTNYILTNVRRKDAGVYICRIETTEPVELQHKLIVQYAPKATVVGPPNRSVVQGSTLVLQCEADGVPRPTITWRKVGDNLPTRSKIHEGYSLTINNVQRNTEGTYTCTANNGIGEPSTAHLSVIVEYPPIVTSKQPMVHSGEGEHASLTCIAHGHPKPTVTWGIGNRRIVDSKKHTKIQDKGHKHMLTVYNITEHDFGEYYCNATNSQGTNYTKIRLTGLPGTPHIISRPAGQEEDSYLLAWETESTSPILMYRLQFMEKTDNVTKLHGPGHWHDALHSAKNAYKRGLMQRAEAVRERGDTYMNSKEFSKKILQSLQKSSNSAISDERFRHMAHLIEKLETEKDYQAIVRVENKFGWSEPSQIFYFHTRREVSVGHAATVTSGSGAPVAQSRYSMALLLLTLMLPATQLLIHCIFNIIFKERILSFL